jgi:hypothetical protein
MSAAPMPVPVLPQADSPSPVRRIERHGGIARGIEEFPLVRRWTDRRITYGFLNIAMVLWGGVVWFLIRSLVVDSTAVAAQIDMIFAVLMIGYAGVMTYLAVGLVNRVVLKKGRRRA